MRNRLIDIALVSLTAFGLLACSSTQTNTVSAQVLADANGLLSTSKAIIVAMEAQNPKVFTDAQQAQITASENAAAALLSTLNNQSSADAGAMSLLEVDNDINVLLQAIEAALPAAAVAYPQLTPFVPEFDAAAALLPIIEAYVNSVVQNAQSTTPAAPVAAASAPLQPIAAHYDADQARKLLGIPQVAK